MIRNHPSVMNQYALRIALQESEIQVAYQKDLSKSPPYETCKACPPESEERFISTPT